MDALIQVTIKYYILIFQIFPMKVNFRNRKIQLNHLANKNSLNVNETIKIKKEELANQSSKKNILHLSDQPTKNGLNSAKSNNHDSRLRMELDNGKDSFLDNIADVVHLVGQEYIHYLNEGKEDRFRAALLSQLTKLQARDRKIVIEYGFSYNVEGEPQFDFSKEQEKFKQWLGQMHFKVVSTSFDYLINKHLLYEEVKVYCSQNLLLNITLFLSKIQKGIKNINLPGLMLYIDSTLNENLEYLLVKYPQAKEMKPNKRLRSEVEGINNLENDQNDMFRHSKIMFQINDEQDYNSEIMKFVNYLIETLSVEKEIDGQKIRFAQAFYQIMETLFMSVYIPETNYAEIMNDLEKKDPDKMLLRRQVKKKILDLEETDKEIKEFKEKVSKYTSYKIGTKINPNTQLFKDNQIKAGFFEIKSTSILRILTKWIEQLEKKIFKAKEYIHKRSFRFKNNQKEFSKLNASQKNDLFLQATKQVENLKRYIKHLRQNAFSIEGQLAMTIKRSKQRLNIPHYEYLVGQYSSKLEDAASSSLISYLNQLIHVLLKIPHNIKQKYEHDEDMLREMDINLITFKISDILRCKCSSHEDQILRIYRELKNISDVNENFKIVRIKDRLELGTRDILINVNFMNMFLCEIQLAVTDEIDTKQQAFDAFNHYLYELKRASLGPIMQSGCIWAHFDQRSRIFKKLKERQVEEYYMSGTVQRVIHKCKEDLVVNSLPFVCSICQKFYFSQQGIIKHKKCDECKKFYQCALCLENRMDQQKLKKFLKLDELLGVFVDDFVEWTSNQPPRFGIIIPKRSKIVEVFFFITIIWKEDAFIVRAVQKEGNKKIQVIQAIKGNEYKQWKKLQENFIVYEWTEKRKVNKTIKPNAIINENLERQKQRRLDQQRKKEQKEKMIEQYRKKWSLKKKDNKSRPGSADSKNSKQSKKSEKPQKGKSKGGKHKAQFTNPKKNLPVIEENQKRYNQNLARRSEKYEFRVAIKNVGTEEDKEEYCLVLGPFFQESQIRKELKQISNQQLVKQNLDRKMQVVFLQDMNIQQQLALSEEQAQKYKKSLVKISQLYLDANAINDATFIAKMPNIKVVHMNYNRIKDLKDFQSLNNLTELMLQYNEIKKIDSLQGKIHLIDLNLCHNFIQQLQGLDDLKRLQTLNLADNYIKVIQNMSNLTNLRKLDLSYNSLKSIQGLENLVKLQELDLSDNFIQKMTGISSLKSLKRLNLYKNTITKIQCLQNCTQLKYLDLHRNRIYKIENLDNLRFLTYLNLSTNKIRKIQGLTNNNNLLQLDLSQNQISGMMALIENSFSLLKKIDLSYNGIRSILSEEIFQFIPNLEKLFLNSNPIKFTETQKKHYLRLAQQFKKRSGFNFYITIDDQVNIDSDDQYEEEERARSQASRRKSLASQNINLETQNYDLQSV